MNFDELREGLQGAVPFNQHLGLEMVSVGRGTGAVRLPDRESLLNHVGTQHASGLFAASEAASGAAMLGAIGEQITRIVPLVRGAEIAFAKPARGAILAEAKLQLEPDELLSRLAKAGDKVEVDVGVELRDTAGVVVATAKVRWHLRATE